MKINAVLLPGRKLARNNTTDKSLIIITTVLISAVLTSVIVFILSDQYIRTNVADLIDSNIKTNTFVNKTELFINMLIPTVLFHMILIVFSTSIIGDFIIGVLSFVRISGLSMMIAYIYSAYGLTGIEYVFMVIAPGKIFYIFSLILCIKNAFYIVNNIRKKEKITDTAALTIRYILSLLSAVLSVIVDLIMFTAFSGLFSF